MSVEELSVYFQRQGGKDAFPAGSEGLKVVSSLSFDVKRPETFGIVGESGCGKSMTAYSIMGILPSQAYCEGRIIFEGQDLRTLDKEQKRKLRGNRMSMIFQEPMTSLNPVLTIGYQIAEVIETHEGLSRREAMNRAVELLTAVRIPSPSARVKDYPHHLSGGMRQRVMIAMAIACNPSLLIADEPTTALDVTIQAQILALLHTIKEDKGMSILLITHDLGIIYGHTQRVAVMYAGRIMEQTATRQLFETPLHPYTIGLLHSLPGRRDIPLKPIPGMVPKPDELPSGCKFSNRCIYVITECKEREPALAAVDGDHYVRCFRARENLWGQTWWL